MQGRRHCLTLLPASRGVISVAVCPGSGENSGPYHVQFYNRIYPLPLPRIRSPVAVGLPQQTEKRASQSCSEAFPALAEKKSQTSAVSCLLLRSTPYKPTYPASHRNNTTVPGNVGCTVVLFSINLGYEKLNSTARICRCPTIRSLCPGPLPSCCTVPYLRYQAAMLANT